MKKVVVIGGGTGSSRLLEAIKDLPIKLYVITTVFDSGGSTGILRNEFNIPAIGDIRQNLVSLSNDNDLWNRLMNYRFNKLSSLNPHTLGNLIITSMIDIKHDFYEAIRSLSDVFRIKGEIIPITNDPSIQLQAIYDDNTFQEHEHLIPNVYKKINKITFNKQHFNVNQRAINILKDADFIIFSSGSLYTSLIANLAIEQIQKAIISNQKAKLIYLCNLVTQPGETDNMNIYDHVCEIEKYLDNHLINIVIVNNKLHNNNNLIAKYENNKQFFLLSDKHLKKQLSPRIIISEDLIDTKNIINIRHNKKTLNVIFMKIFKE